MIYHFLITERERLIPIYGVPLNDAGLKALDAIHTEYMEVTAETEEEAERIVLDHYENKFRLYTLDIQRVK